MSYTITDDCIACGSCLPECPYGAITEAESRFQVDPRRCPECVGGAESPRCAAVCPVGAAVPDPAHKETPSMLEGKARRLLAE